MRVLQICHKIPFPPSDGGAIAMHQITEGLLVNGNSVKVFALKLKECQESAAQIPDEYLDNTRFEAHEIDQRVKPFKAFLNLFTRQSYNVSRFFSRVIEQRLESLLQNDQFDIIQFEGLYVTPYLEVIKRNSQAKLLYRSHNIEHLIWERMAKASRNPLKRWYLSLLATRLKKYELNVLHGFDGLIAISPIDLAFFKKNGIDIASVVIPVAMQGQTWANHPTELIPGSVFHLGSMDWRPNQEGIEWFLEKVWPMVMKKTPEMKFYLAGKSVPRRFFKYASENVIISGWVSSAVEFMADKQIMVVPLLSGSGMRVKIIEGMAARKTIVSTSIGAEGIGCEDGREIFIADDAEKMADIIVWCYQNPEKAGEIAGNALKLAEEKFNPAAIWPGLINFYDKINNG